MTHDVTDFAGSGGGAARLDLGVARRGDLVELALRSHSGPLRVQKPFWPEGDAPVHVILLHPPGGIVGGDRLEISVEVGRAASALVTTPAAQKLYRSAERESSLAVRIEAQRDAAIEWFPGETLVFDGARARQRTRIDLAAGARAIGWEILCFGRPASRLPFERGALRQRLEIAREGVPLLVESLRVDGGSRVLSDAWGLADRPVCGTFYATAPSGLALAERVRASVASRGAVTWAATDLGDLLVVRALADHVEDLRSVFVDVWRIVRPAALGRDAVPPRIWAT